MIASAFSSLLIPLALTAGINSESPAPSYHHQVRAFVTGYNTVAGQTDNTPCVAASGANICGRHDAVACPRSIGLGTIVEIRGSTYVCEDRLAKKFDDRFDISCDKDTKCPPQVTGWVDVKVFDIGRLQQTNAAAKSSDTLVPQQAAASTRVSDITRKQPSVVARTFAALHPHLAAAAAKIFPTAKAQPAVAIAKAAEPLRPQLAVATGRFIARTSSHLVASVAKPVAVLRGRT
jgi:hypothetical protein